MLERVEPMADQPISPAPGKAEVLLLVDDDKAFVQRLARAMEKRGFVTETAESVAEARAKVEASNPDFAVVDMRLEDGNGLDVIEILRSRRPEARAIILTGYGNIATAVTAVKLGAVDYLSKPADADEIHSALMQKRDERSEEHTSELQSLAYLVCRLLLEKKK